MSQFISLSEGVAMTTAYRTERTSLIANGSISDDLLPLHETFEKAQVTKLLDKMDCRGLRIYLGLEEGKVRLILVGTDNENKDILTTTAASSVQSREADGEDDLLERGVRCPNECLPASPLNP